MHDSDDLLSTNESNTTMLRNIESTETFATRDQRGCEWCVVASIKHPNYPREALVE